MKINLRINKMMIKMNKQRYFDLSFRYSRTSWGVLGCPGVIRLTLSNIFSFDIMPLYVLAHNMFSPASVLSRGFTFE